MTTDTEKRLAEIRERAEKATKGDWYTVGQPWLSSDVSTWVIAGSQDPHAGKAVCEPIISDCFEGEDDQDLERQEQDAMWQAELDMDFIAHARSDIPFLLAEIERLSRGSQSAAEQTCVKGKLKSCREPVSDCDGVSYCDTCGIWEGARK